MGSPRTFGGRGAPRGLPPRHCARPSVTSSDTGCGSGLAGARCSIGVPRFTLLRNLPARTRRKSIVTPFRNSVVPLPGHLQLVLHAVQCRPEPLLLGLRPKCAGVHQAHRPHAVLGLYRTPQVRPLLLCYLTAPCLQARRLPPAPVRCPRQAVAPTPAEADSRRTPARQALGCPPYVPGSVPLERCACR